MTRKLRGSKVVRAVALELVIYGALVTVYFFSVLHFLGDWLVTLERQRIRTYAAVAILLVIVQAAVLEAVTTRLLRWLRRGRAE